MATNVEKMLSHRRKRMGFLVPLLEDLFMQPLQIETDEDADFIHKLVLAQIDREKERSLHNFYSPSALASCMRQVYLARHSRSLNIKRARSTKIEPNFYFATGDWLHLKWQFALYRLDQVKDDSEFKLLDVEVGVVSKHGDHGGTADAIAVVQGVPTVIDFKGVNVRTFKQAQAGDAPLNYKIQVADYMMLLNAQRRKLFPTIERALIVFENKGGPSGGSPIALHEVEVPLKDHLPEIRHRLERLRQHEKSNTIPEPECKSTRQTLFLGCPFRNFCKAEVKAAQKSDSGDSAKYNVAVPERRRTSSSRRNKR